MVGDYKNNLKYMQVHSRLFHAIWCDGDCICLSADMTIEWNRTQKGGRCGDLYTLTAISILCHPFAHVFSNPIPWTKCIIVLTEISSEVPDLIKWWPTCPNLNVANASQSQRTCEIVPVTCLHLPHLGLSTRAVCMNVLEGDSVVSAALSIF